MRRSNLDFAKLAVLPAICFLLVAPQVLATAPARYDGGVAEFIRTHPGYRGYLTPRPPYPNVARVKVEQGSIMLRITFAKEGQVSEVKLIESSGYRDLDDNTLNYIKKYWRSTLGQKTTTKILTLEYSLG